MVAIQEELAVVNKRQKVTSDVAQARNNLERLTGNDFQQRRQEILTRIEGYNSRLQNEQRAHDKLKQECDGLECDNERVAELKNEVRNSKVRRNETHTRTSKQSYASSED